jgi:predicted lipid-binding transport protein (Tim44 family)
MLNRKLWPSRQMCDRAAAMNPENPEHASKPSDDESKNRNGGGVFIAIGTIAGALVGGYMGQPSAGLLAGLALGALVALLIWWQGR